MAKVSIIIATYNGKQFLEKSVPSVVQSDYQDYEIVICDDCSTDGSYEYLQALQQQYPHIRLLKNESNQGAAKTRNNAVQSATGEILIFLDNDTEVEPQWMQQPLAILDQDPTIGGVQSTLIDYHHRDQIQLAGVKLIPHACWGAPLLRGLPLDQRFSSPQEIIALSAALFVRKTAHQKIGGFDEKLGVYTEDLEYSLRLWIYGFRIVNAPQSLVFHWTKKVEDRAKMHASRAQIYYHLTKNSLRSLIKNYSALHLMRYLPWCMLIILVRMGMCCIRRDWLSIRKIAEAIIWTLQNMSDTLKAREIVQKQRAQSDQTIAAKVFTKENILTIYQNYFT